MRSLTFLMVGFGSAIVLALSLALAEAQQPSKFPLDAASVKFIVSRGVLLDVAKYKTMDPLPSNYWITLEDLQATAKAQKVEIRKGDVLLIRTGWRKMWDQPGPDGRADPAHRQYLQPSPAWARIH